MEFFTFKEEIIAYLPIDFYDEENNKYRDYLLEALEQNWENEKYQFCILATNMLFMSFLYKSFWFVINKDFETVKDFLLKNPTLKLDKIFDYGFVPEKNFIDYFGKVFDVPSSSTKIYKELIDDRDSCAHANGNIEFEKDDFEAQLQRYYKAITKFFNKHKEKLIFSFLKDYQEFLKKNFDTITTFTFFDNWCRKEKISIKELEVIFNEINNKKLDSQNLDAYLIETSKILLKLYIGLKTDGKVNYTFESFKNDLGILLLNYKSVPNDIISYVQNEFHYSYVVMEQSIMDEILELNTDSESDDSMDDFTFSEEKSLFSHIEEEVGND